MLRSSSALTEDLLPKVFELDDKIKNLTLEIEQLEREARHCSDSQKKQKLKQRIQKKKRLRTELKNIEAPFGWDRKSGGAPFNPDKIMPAQRKRQIRKPDIYSPERFNRQVRRDEICSLENLFPRESHRQTVFLKSHGQSVSVKFMYSGDFWKSYLI